VKLPSALVWVWRAALFPGFFRTTTSIPLTGVTLPIGAPARTLAAAVERAVKTLVTKIVLTPNAAIKMLMEDFERFIVVSPLVDRTD